MIFYLKLGSHQIYLFLLILLGSFSSFSQELYFENYSTKNGLPSNEVYSLFQDSNGLIWFATDRGLCSFNGYNFETWGLQEGLPSTTILKFFPQKNGDIWCSTINNRFFYFNPLDYVIHKYAYNDLLEDVSKGRIPNDFYIESDGSIHVSYSDKTGVVSIGANGILVDKISEGNKTSLFNDSMKVVIEEMNDGQLFSYSKDLIVKTRPSVKNSIKIVLTGENRNYYRVAKRGEVKLVSGSHSVYIYKNNLCIKTIETNKRIISIGFIDASHFWVGEIKGGAIIYDLEGNYDYTILEDESVSDMHFDHENGTWISTVSSGVFYSPNRLIKKHLSNCKSYINSLSIGRNNDLVANTLSGRQYKKEEGNWKLIKVSTDHVASRHQYYTSLDITLIFSGKHTILLEENEILKSSSYITKFSDEKNAIPWFTGHFRFYSYDLEEGIKYYSIGERINDICPTTHPEKVFLGTKRGLYIFNKKTEKEERINNPLVNVHITDIDRLNKDYYLIATRGNGLVIMNHYNSLFFALTEQNGLSSNLINELYIQNDSTLWVCTNLGLNNVSINSDNTLSILALTNREGVLDNDVIDIEVIDEVAWVATRSGLCSFPVDLIQPQTSKKEYFLKITSTRVNGELVSDLTALSYKQNKIEIDFQAISFKQNEKLNYRYHLKGSENSWNYTNNLKIIYEKLIPGNYTFELQVGANGKWNDQVIALPIIIYAPIYDTVWFKIAAVLLLIILIYLFFKFRILRYNGAIIREILRQLLKRLKKKSFSFTVRSNGKDIKINTNDVLYVKSADNYIEIYTMTEKIITREKLSNFLELVPDPIEYLRIQRSYIVRIDKISAKSKNSVVINGLELKVGNTYLDVLKKIYLS